MRYKYTADARLEEQEMARAVQAAKARLKAALGNTPTRPARDIEAAAQEFAEVPAVGNALREYQAAVNRFWLYTEDSGLTRSMVAAFVKAHRRNLRGTDIREDLDAEATLAMRGVITSYVPDQGATLRTWAYRSINRRLSEVKGEELSAGTAVGHDRRTVITNVRGPMSDLGGSEEEEV